MPRLSPRLPHHTFLSTLQSTRSSLPRSCGSKRLFNSTPYRRTSKPVWPYLYSPFKSMAPSLDPYFKQVDSLSEAFIDRLRKAVAIPSVSADEERRPDVVKVTAAALC